MVDQGIDQRAVGVIDRGMAHKPRLLGDDEHVVVLVADIERDGLALHRALFGSVRHLVHHRIARAQRMLFRHGGAVDVYCAVFHGPRRRATAGIQPVCGQHGIDTRTGIFGAGGIAFQRAHLAHLLMMSFANDPSDQKQSKTAGHTDIGDVEHREIHEAEVDEVNHVA